MADIKNKTTSIYINHAPAEQALVSLQKQADVLQQKIKKGEDAGKKMVTEITKLNRVQDDIKKVQDQIDKGLRPSFNQLQTTVSKLRNELKRMSEDAPGYAAKFKAFNKASTELDRLGRSINAVKTESGGLKGILSQALPVVGIAAAASAVTSFFSGAIEEAAAAEEQTARLTNVLDNLGKSDAFDRITQQSDNLAASLTYLDNDDINGVFEKLLTYGKLTEGQMAKLAPIIIDFAAKTRQSLPEATDVILKALEGNGKALKVFGINIKDAGTEAERFNIITTDLAQKVNGAAAAFGETFAGGVASSKQEIANLKEEIGGGLLPVWQAFLSVIAGAINGIKILAADIKNGVVDAFSRDGGFFRKLNEARQKGFEENKKNASNAAILMSKEDIEKQRIILNGAITLYQDYVKTIGSISKKSTAERLQIEQELNRQEQLISQYRSTYQQSLNDEQAKKDRDFEAGAEARAKAAKERSDKAAAEAKRRADEAKRLYEQAKRDYLSLEKQFTDEYSKETLRAIEYEIKKLNEKYDADVAGFKKALNFKLLTEAEYTQKLLQVEELRQKGLAEIRAKYAQAPAELLKTDKQPLPDIKIGKSDFGKFLETEAARLATNIADTKDKIELASGRKKLKLQLDLLQLERDQALLNTELTEQQRQIIIERYNQQRSAIVEASFQAQAERIIGYAQSAAGIFESLNQIASNADQTRIAEINANTEREREAAKKLLDGKIIDQQAYDKKVKAINDKNAKQLNAIERKEFERQKRMSIINTIINGAQGIVSTLAAKPGATDIISLGTFRAINVAIVAATTAAQIAAIASQKFVPKFAKGGLFDGPTHSQGGMPIINPRTGSKVAEIEGGEPILSRSTYRNNKPLVDALLYSSMYGGGQRIQPMYMQRGYTSLNLPDINTNVSRRQMFATGGIFNGGSEFGSSGNSEQLSQLINVFINKLNEPIKAYTVFSEANAAKEMADKVKSETTLSRR